MTESGITELADAKATADPERFFRTDHVTANLRKRTLRGGAITALTQGLKFAITLTSTAILARLVDPKQTGLVTMVTAVTGFIGMFKDMGLSMATVQRENINHRQVSTLFWTNLALSAALMVITAASAPLIVWFYSHPAAGVRRPELAWITIAFAGGFLLSGLTVQHQALLQRQMRFLTLSAIDIISLVIGATAGIVSANRGAGYWALVIMPLSISAVYAVAVWIACGWRPARPLRHTGVRSMLAFGGKITGFNIVNYLARNLDNALIGRVWGAEQIGLYGNAYRLLTLPLTQINAPISAVAVPGLSRLQNDPQRFRSYYLKALSLMTFVSMPLVAALIVLADELILIVLGSKWQGATSLFRILGISAFVQPVLNPSSWLYIATGQTGRMFKWGLVASPVLCLSFAIGVYFSTSAVAWSYSAAILLLTWPCLHYSVVGTSITVRDICGAVWQSLLSSLLAGGIGFGVLWLARPRAGTAISSIAAGLIMAAVYLLLTLYFFDGRILYVSAWRELRGKDAAS